MTADDIQARLDEACRTLNRLLATGGSPTPNLSRWPRFIQDYDDAARALPCCSRSEQPDAWHIDRMAEAFSWFALIGDELLRRTLWQVSMMQAQSIHGPFAKISRTTGRPRATIRSRYHAALVEIAESLDGLQNAEAA